MILDTGAEPKLIKENFLLAAWALKMKKVKANRLQSASNAPLEVKGKSSFETQMGQLQKKVVSLVAPNQATNFILGTAFNVQFMESISQKAGLTTPVNSSFIPVVDKT